MHYGKKHDLPFGIMDVAGLLRLNIRRRAPGQVYVDCPICGDRRGKMNLNTEKDLWRCNYCGEGGGMLSLYKRSHVEMKQLGNLAVICAQRPELLMQLRAGLISVQAKNRAAMEAAWNDDARIERMIYELNFGTFSKERLV